MNEKGSSPLARGLPTRPFPRTMTAGIIPARAGFTTCTTSAPRSSPDHPRSRGVYLQTTYEEMAGQGSSPLARGLPLGEDPHRGAGRIIPARAGFMRPGPAPRPPTSEDGREGRGGLEIFTAIWDPGAPVECQKGATVGITVTTMTIEDIERRRAEIKKIIQTPEFQERMQEDALLDREIDLFDELEDLDFLQYGSRTD